MGKLTEETVQIAELLVEQLAPLGDVTSRKMFGGVGIFESKAMFALVSSESVVHFKADDSNRQAFEYAGSEQFHSMPYFSVPKSVTDDPEKLQDWAKRSIAVNASK